MTATTALMDEHTDILSMLEVLESVCKRLEGAGKVNLGDIEKILDFFKGFADECHHQKEEEYFFPEMEKAGIPRERGPIGVMLSEHDLGRKYVRGMRSALEGYRDGKPDAVKSFVGNARLYANLLRQHIQKENTILFPLADARLRAEQQEVLSKKFDQLESERAEGEEHAQFRKILEQLRSVYRN
jgi:hemerythrin-like domain-containing protein